MHQGIGMKLFRSPFIVTLLAGVCLHALGQTSTPITKANWQQHPQIVEIRSLVQKINEELQQGLLTVQKREFEYCQPGEDTLRTLATTQAGRVVRYQRAGGSDDSSVSFEYY